MKYKQILCACLAALMMASPTALAAELEEAPALETGTVEETITAPETEPVQDPAAPGIINVTLPVSGQIVVNPYGLPVNTAVGTSMAQIVSEPLPIINHSAAPVDVWVSAVGSADPSSGIAFVSAPPQENTLAKEIFLYAEFKNDDRPWAGSYVNGENQVLIGTQLSDPQPVMTLGGNEATGRFRLFGSAAVTPEIPWDRADMFHVTFIFTFTAVDVQPETDAEASWEPPFELPPAPEETFLPEDIPAQDAPPYPTEDSDPIEVTEPAENPDPDETSDPIETPAPEEPPATEDIPPSGEGQAAEHVPEPEEAVETGKDDGSESDADEVDSNSA